MPTTVEFEEVMKGLVKLGESDCELGELSGQALRVHLKIHTEDIDFFLTDPQHRGPVGGSKKASSTALSARRGTAAKSVIGCSFAMGTAPRTPSVG